MGFFLSLSGNRRAERISGNREFESRTPSRFRFHPDVSTATFNHLLTKCEPNARAGNFPSVQTLEHDEYPLSVFRINADAIVPHREQPPFGSSHGGDVDPGRCLVPVLDRIANKVLKHLRQHVVLSYHSRQWIRGHRSTALLNRRLET